MTNPIQPQPTNPVTTRLMIELKQSLININEELYRIEKACNRIAPIDNVLSIPESDPSHTLVDALNELLEMTINIHARANTAATHLDSCV
jgi:hypothetical protein